MPEYLKEAKYQKLICEYLDHLIKVLPVLKKNLEDRDFLEIEIFGHRLSGNGKSFGFPQFSRFGSRIESAAKKGQDQIIGKLVTEFETLIDQVRQEYFD